MIWYNNQSAGKNLTQMLTFPTKGNNKVLDTLNIQSKRNEKKVVKVVNFTYFGSVENNIFAIRKDADGPRW